METIQIVLFVFAGILFISGIYLSTRRESSTSHSIIIIFSALALTLIAAVGPDTIKNFSFDKGHLTFDRYTPKERAEALAVVKDNATEEEKVKLEELVEKAEALPAEQKAPEDYLLLATEAWHDKDYEQALMYAYSGLALEPEDKRVRATLTHRLGAIYTDIGNNKIAEEHYKKAIQIDTDFFWPHNNLGVLYSDTKRPNEAEKSYKEAIRIDPNHASPHYNLGVLYSDTNRPEEAEESYKETIRLDPDISFAHNNLGVLYEKTNRLKEAEKEYREAVRLDPNNSPAHNNLGNLYKNTDRPE